MIKADVYSISEFKELQHEELVFITCASFEERVFSIPSCIDNVLIRKAYVFSTNATDKIAENCEALRKLLGNDVVISNVRKNDPFSYRDSFSDAINNIILEGFTNLYIDITTFNHEMLLILLNIIIKKMDSLSKIRFLYNGAKEYSVGDSNENKWLSKGCKEVRSILGYPGFLVPKNPTCLIILVGFEHERASALINIMEPDMVLIGHGKIENACVMSEEHMEPMRYFEEVHRTLFASRSNMHGFDFSVKDVESTMAVLEEKINETSEYDHIIVPLNTKTSTLAAGLVALKNPKIQVCYAEPEMYNNDNYSIPGETIICYMIK